MKNQLKIGVILSYVYTVFNMLVQLIYTPVMIHLLGKSEYGLYTLVGSVVSYLSLFSLGFSSAYLRFYTRLNKDKDKTKVARLNGLFLSVFLLMSILALVCGLILAQYSAELFGNNLTIQELKKAKVLMQILVFNVALTLPSSVFESMISSKEKFLFQRLVAIFSVVANPLIAFPLLIMGYGSVAMVMVTTVITLCRLFVNVWYCFKVLNIPFLFDKFDFSLLKEISYFSFFLFLNMIIDQLNWSVDKFILGRVSGTTSVAIYGVGSQINSLFLSFSTAISSVFSPRVNRIATTESKSIYEDFTDLFIKVGRIQFFVLSLICTGFIFFGSYFIINIYASVEYQEAYIISLFLTVPLIIPLIQNLGIEIQRALNKHQFRAILYFIMAILNVLISIPLAVNFGAVGPAFGTGLSLVLVNGICMNLYYHKVLKIDIVNFWKNILNISKGLVIPCVLGIVIIRFDLVFSTSTFLFWCSLYALTYIICFYFFGFNSSEKMLFKKPVKGFITFITKNIFAR